MTTYQLPKLTQSVSQFDSLRARVGLLLFAVGMVVLYVAQTSVVGSRTFVINELQTNVRTLRLEERSLEVQIAEARSMKSIESRLAGKQFVRATNIAYVTAPQSTAVAQR
jgi:hypothetical protein